MFACALLACLLTVLTFTVSPPTGAGSEKAVTTDSSGSYRIDLAPGTYAARKTVTADFVYTIELL